MPYGNIYPPKNGGMLRCFNVLVQYAKFYNVTAVFFQSLDSFSEAIKQYPILENVTLISTSSLAPKRDLFSLVLPKIGNALKYRWLMKSFKGPACGTFLKLHPVLNEVLSNHEFDAIDFENLSLVSQSSFFRRKNKNAKLVFNAYNVDSVLAKQALDNGTGTMLAYISLKELERNLYKKIDILLCCSKQDQDLLLKMNNNKIANTVVIPNGVDIENAPYYYKRTVYSVNNILFCGSLDYGPNKEGLLWFYKSIWPLILKENKEVKLVVVGRGSTDSYRELIEDSSIDFIGEVESLSPYYNSCCLSIAPLKSGSGTRLKILEAMSYGTPVVSTSIGAEGIQYEEGTNILIADSDSEFAHAVLRLIKEEDLAYSISENARKFVELNYSWEAIGVKLKSLEL